jgi:hypothetical protein
MAAAPAAVGKVSEESLYREVGVRTLAKGDLGQVSADGNMLLNVNLRADMGSSPRATFPAH